jgi:hypothetical protein
VLESLLCSESLGHIDLDKQPNEHFAVTRNTFPSLFVERNLSSVDADEELA